MSLLRRERDITSMEQLGQYIDAGKGQAKGRLWSLIYEEGGEQEYGASGTFVRDSHDATVRFSSHPESQYPFMAEEVTAEMIASSSIKVYSRKRI